MLAVHQSFYQMVINLLSIVKILHEQTLNETIHLFQAKSVVIVKYFPAFKTIVKPSGYKNSISTYIYANYL